MSHPPSGIGGYPRDPDFIVHKMVVPSPPPVAPLKNQITLLRVIPTMTFQNSLLTPLLSEAFVTGLLPN